MPMYIQGQTGNREWKRNNTKKNILKRNERKTEKYNLQ